MKSPYAVLVVLCLFTACSPRELHLSDRHGLSYDPIAAYGRAHPGTTLVLFDYHHDSGVGPGYLEKGSPASYDWVGTLVDRGLVERVLWVSGRTLLLPNQNARQAWLLRLTSRLPAERRQRILDRVVLTDSGELFRGTVPGPVVVSLDLDILTKDPGPSPLLFLDEITHWTLRQNPALVTVALSAAYQPDPPMAWTWLEHLVSDWPASERNWTLDLGPREQVPESAEERQAWERWAARPRAWRPATGSFRPGPGVWFAAPPGVRKALLEKGVVAGSVPAEDILRAWSDPGLVALERSPAAMELEKAGIAAALALSEGWAGQKQSLPEAGEGPGLAIRLHVEGHDRGCLALWQGVPNLQQGARFAAQEASNDPRYDPVTAQEAPFLTVQPALLGLWTETSGPKDFVPGFHSLMVLQGTKRTLIQAPLALERSWDRETMLEALALKAQLGPGGWRSPGLKWYRAITLWGELPAIPR